MTKHYGMIIDLRRCIGCHTCTVACKKEHHMVRSWINVYTIGPRGKYPNLSMYHHPILCNHCENPPCAEACSVRAIGKQTDGRVLVDASLCNGCGDCLDACPLRVLHLNSEKGVVEKCTLCSERLESGLEPFCARCCPMRAITFGDLNDAGGEVSKIIYEKKAYVLLPRFGTQPSVYYCSP